MGYLRAFLAVVCLLVPATSKASDPLDGRPIVALTVDGLRHLDEAVVAAQIESRPGRTYFKSTADRDIVRLERLRVFSDIAITPAAEGDGVRVVVRVVETLRLLPAVSLAVTDESGTSIGPAVKVLSINGHPQELTALARFGGEGLVEVSEVSPFLTGRRLWHSGRVSLRDRTNRLDDFKERSLDVDVRVGARGSDTWKAGAIVQVYSVHADESGVTLSADDSDVFTNFGAIFERDTRDSWKMATRGWWNSVDAIWHTGSGDYGTLNLDVRRYQPLGARQTFLVTALLTMQSGEPGVDVPTYMDYALGGANTVRGWDFASRRGKNQFITSLEYRYTMLPTRAFRVGGLNFYGGIALAAFADAGSAWNEGDDFSGNAIAGGGFGLRIFVPYIDMIRLDFAFGDHALGLFGVGEKAVAQRNRVR